MDATRAIQIAVARADLILCWMARVLAVVMLAAILLTTLVLAWRFSNRIRYGRPTHYIDYDAPGVDITSEGPEAFTANWFIRIPLHPYNTAYADQYQRL